MLIRPAADDDAPAIARIYAHWVTDSVVTFDLDVPSASEWVERLHAADAAGHPVLVGEEDGTVVGYATVTAWKPKRAYDRTVEDSVYLDPGAVGRGRGRALLTALVDACRAAGLTQLVALVADAGSDASLRLHRELGFRDVGRMTRVGFKHDRWVDVDVLQLAL